MEPIKIHWKKLHSYEYLGAYSIESADLILTIKGVKNETVTGADGKKEECTVVRFVEPVKPMILNVTNAKTIQKIYSTPYIDDWVGKKIQLYSAEIKAFGELVDALRIRPFKPKSVAPVQTAAISCGDCKKNITEFGGASAEKIAGHTKKKYGMPLCAACAQKRTGAVTESVPAETEEITDIPVDSDGVVGLSETELKEFADSTDGGGK